MFKSKLFKKADELFGLNILHDIDSVGNALTRMENVLLD